MPKIVSVALIIAGCLGVAVSAFPDSESAEDEILQIRAESNEAIRKHDADGVVAAFDQTYQITTGSGTLFHDSPEKEKELWTEIFARFPDVVYVRTPSRIDVSTYLPRAAESGTWVGNWTGETGSIEVGGSYSASWIKVDGRWKIQAEMFVTLYCSGAGC
jgi:hypothetical protein